jgi:hypothetical protein
MRGPAPTRDSSHAISLLDGNTFRDSRSVDRKGFVWDLQFGVAATWGLQRLGFSIVRRSEEFARQGKSDKFGQLTYSFAY